MTTHLAEPEASYELHDSTAARAASWPYVCCMVANALLVVVLWSFSLTLTLNSIFRIFVEGAATVVVVSCFALATLFTFASRPTSIGRIALGAGLMAGTAAVIPISPLCLRTEDILWNVAVLLVVTPLVATGILCLFGLRMHLTRTRPASASRPWQFSTRSLIALTVVIACYAAVISNTVVNESAVKMLNGLVQRGFGIDYLVVRTLVAACHLLVGAMEFSLRRRRRIVPIAVLGSLLLLPAFVDLDWYIGQASVLFMLISGTVLLSVAGTIFPWWLAGVHTTWEKPVFER